VNPLATYLDDLGPERIFHYYQPAAGLRAVVVLDTVRFGMTGGGVRMLPDISLAEMVRLARAMTYKFALLDLPVGGAKAGIWADPHAPDRVSTMAAFLEAIEPLTSNGIYYPGADMGTSAADFTALHGQAGQAQALGRQLYDGMPLEDQLTGYGVVVAAATAMELDGRTLAGARVAIEGFGKVGGGAARFFAREGAQVVAVSTVRGTRHDPAGLDIDALLALRGEHGDAAVERYPGGQLLPPAALFALPVDVLVPGARPDAITAANVEAVNARYVVPAANIPYGADVVARLHARGIVALPDFVANAGGVLAGVVGLQGGNADDAFRTVRDRVSGNVRRVQQRAVAGGTDPVAAAVALARERLRSL